MDTGNCYFLMIDQPMCSYCSARTEVIGDFLLYQTFNVGTALFKPQL